MFRKLISLLFLAISLPVIVLAEVPQSYTTLDPNSTFPGLAAGNIPDEGIAIVSKNQDIRSGVQGVLLYSVFLDAPVVADADWFANDQAVTTASSYVTFLDKTSSGAAPIGFTGSSRRNKLYPNATNASTGRPFIRNFTVTPNQSTTGTLTLGILDAQGNIRELSNAWTNSSTAYTSAACGYGVVYAYASVAFTASTTVDIGFGNIFGLPYPLYNGTPYGRYFDTLGDDYPADADNGTFVAGLADSTTADWYGTWAPTTPDGTNDYVLTYFPSIVWSPGIASGQTGGYPAGSWTFE